MWEYILEHAIDILFAGVTTFMGVVTKAVLKERKKEREAEKEKRLAETKTMIQQELRPVVEELHRLEKQIQDVKAKEKDDVEKLQHEFDKDVGLILASYKFRLVQLCIAYLKQGYMTTEQCKQLSEFYKVYHGLNGNGQAQEYYERAIKLPIKDDQPTD